MASQLQGVDRDLLRTRLESQLMSLNSLYGQVCDTVSCSTVTIVCDISPHRLIPNPLQYPSFIVLLLYMHSDTHFRR